MVKTKASRRRKRFQFSKNRKRLNKNKKNTGKIKCTDIKQFWNDKKAANTNAREMGLSFDPNRTIPIPNSKQERLKIVKYVNGFVEEDIDMEAKSNYVPRKIFVAEKLEEDAKAPRKSHLRLPKGYVTGLNYFIDKYNLSYDEMEKDRQNHYQLTWKQFRSRIKKYMSIPEQFNTYLESRNLKPEDTLNWKEYSED